MPCMMNARWVTHALIARAMTILFLFQMAILGASMSARLGKEPRKAGPGSKVQKDTDIRMTIKSEAAERLR